MSRVAKKDLQIPSGVDFIVKDQFVTVKKGSNQLSHTVHSTVKIQQTEKGYIFEPYDSNDTWALAGTTRAILANLVEGVANGYTKELELVGVGYRVKLEGNTLVFSLGYSHSINFPLPKNVAATVDKNVNLTLKSIDKQLLGQVAADIISLRKPDAYKGKGVRVKGKVLKLKEVKKK
ncbi:MAG: 50S ribosomal protein L6 [Pseudomonadota bacterium]|nr:50S ribosomal protein L6 [Pseudomonadota bacterium]